jgi:hypothetical protein
MQEALRRLDDNQQTAMNIETPPVERSVILDYLAYAMYMVNSYLFIHLQCSVSMRQAKF